MVAILRRFSVGVAFRDYSCDKIVIGAVAEPHYNVARKRAEIGQLTFNHAHEGADDGRFDNPD